MEDNKKNRVKCWFNKLIDDTMKVEMNWSSKKLTTFTTFVFILLLGTFIVISDKILDKVVNPYAIQVFNSLLGFEILLMGITEVGKKFINKNE